MYVNYDPMGLWPTWSGDNAVISHQYIKTSQSLRDLESPNILSCKHDGKRGWFKELSEVFHSKPLYTFPGQRLRFNLVCECLVQCLSCTHWHQYGLARWLIGPGCGGPVTHGHLTRRQPHADVPMAWRPLLLPEAMDSQSHHQPIFPRTQSQKGQQSHGRHSAGL